MLIFRQKNKKIKIHTQWEESLKDIAWSLDWAGDSTLMKKAKQPVGMCARGLGLGYLQNYI